jgi:hypothetical protein
MKKIFVVIIIIGAILAAKDSLSSKENVVHYDEKGKTGCISSADSSYIECISVEASGEIYEMPEDTVYEECISEISENSAEYEECISEISENSDDDAHISRESAEYGIELLEETLLFYEHTLVDDIGEPIDLIGNVYYFNIQTLFERSGIMSVEIVHGDVVRTTWMCEFYDDIDNGEAFYNDILNAALAMPYQNISVNRSSDNGVSQVSISVWD